MDVIELTRQRERQRGRRTEGGRENGESWLDRQVDEGLCCAPAAQWAPYGLIMYRAHVCPAS